MCGEHGKREGLPRAVARSRWRTKHVRRISMPGSARGLAMAAAALFTLSFASGERVDAMSLMTPGAAPATAASEGLIQVRGGHGGGHSGGHGGFHGGGFHGGGFHGGGFHRGGFHGGGFRHFHGGGFRRHGFAHF